MTEIKTKFGFPLFTRESNNVYLGNNKKLIISDVWSFWDYIIKKANFQKEFMNSLLEQSKNFYNSAEISPLKSKPLLYYYSFLNLAKVIINLDKKYGSALYMHGLEEKHNHRFSNSLITIHTKKNHLKNVSIELLETFDGITIPSKLTLKVKDYLRHCVGVHRSYSEIYNSEEVFSRLYKMKLYKHGEKIIVEFELNTDVSSISALTSQGYNIINKEGINYWHEEVVTGKTNFTRESYYLLSNLLRSKGIWYFISNDGYYYYISKHPDLRYSTESIIYNTMFFLGSITRYHPYMFDKIFSDKEQWLMSEFLTTQPKQFLYLATAKVLGQLVLKAKSSF